MNTTFYKYHGAGNDFIMLDGRGQDFILTKVQIEALCKRHFGIGADGLIVIQDSDVADFHMLYHNADGAEGSLCGNGSRCAIQFVLDLGLVQKSYKFTAADGLHEASIVDGEVRLKMNKVSSWDCIEDDLLIDTGSPHYVKACKEIGHLDVVHEGKKIRYSEAYAKEGVNVNFIEQKDDCLLIRTYERGVENETLACGTGAVAVALASELLNYNLNQPIRVKALGGLLSVEFDFNNNEFTNIYLKGPAVRSFIGTLPESAFS